MTVAVYEESGGVLGALGRRAEAIYTALDPDGRADTRQLFLRLVILREGVEDTRRRVLRSELEMLGASNQRPTTGLSQLTTDQRPLITGVLDAFGEGRLLTFDHDEATRGPTVEVAHEALLREWLRLRSWLDESRNDVRQLRLLDHAAAEWLEAGRDAGFLLRGSRLDQFEAWTAVISSTFGL